MLKLFGTVVLVLIVVAAVRLLLLMQDVRIYKVFWDDLARKPQAENALVYIALGDSAAQSIGASKPMNGYVGLIAKELETKNGRPVHIVNLSTSGATLESVIREQLPQLESIKNLDGAIITVDIGANDVTAQLTAEREFEKKLDELYAKLPEHTIVADLPSFARTRYWQKDGRIKEFNPIVYKMAKKHRLRVAPVYNATAEDTSWLTNSSDVFHPSDRGYRNWAKGFLEVL